MPKTPRPGKISRYIEMPTDLDRRLVDYCDRTGSKYSHEVRRAVERHLLYPESATPLPTRKKKAKNKVDDA